MLPGWVRPSTWYLAGFLIPSGTPPEKSADADEDDEFELVSESPGLVEESSEERRAAQKGHFPSSMGLSFLVSGEARTLTVIVRWGDYAPARFDGEDAKPLSVWQRTAHEESIPVELRGAQEDERHPVSGSRGLELHVVERPITADDLAALIPAGTRSVSVFIVNHRQPNEDNPDVEYAFQAEIEVRSDQPFVPRPDLRGAPRQTGTSRWRISTMPAAPSTPRATASRRIGKSLEMPAGFSVAHGFPWPQRLTGQLTVKLFLTNGWENFIYRTADGGKTWTYSK
jgi:hypothetical protein